MTEPLDGNEALVTDMLRRADTESAVPNDARDRARLAMLSAHDEMTRALADQQRPDAEVFSFDDHQTDGVSTSSPRRLTYLLAVAASLLVLVGLAVGLPPSGGSARLIDSADSDGSEIEAGAEGQLAQAVRLGAGSHRTDVLGLSVEFTLTRSLYLVREGEGVVELAVDPNDSTEARIWVFAPDSLQLANGASSIQQFMDEHPELAPQFVPTVLADRRAGIWSTWDSLGDPSCIRHESCVPIVESPIEVGLVGGRSTDLFEIVLDEVDPDGSTLLIVVWRTPDTAWSASPGVPFGDVLASLEVGPLE